MSFAIQALPEPLREIVEQVKLFAPDESNIDDLRTAWKEHVSRAKQHVPGVCVESDGEVLYLGELSPGCRACKQGTWDCIFVTMACNLNCEFCYSPQAVSRDYAGSVFGTGPEQIAKNYAKTHITGVSFSGGEPFADPSKLLQWAAWFACRYPENHYWVYTNGLLADEDSTRRLGELGVDEIRFNLAATGYNHPTVLKNLASSARFIPNVTVEIPAIPEHASQLLSSLADWCSLGVKFLNLHELMYEPGTNAASMSGPRWDIITADGHHTQVNPESRALTLATMIHVQNKALALSVNDCSLQSKLCQLRGRRRSLAPLTKNPNEDLVAGAFLESYCLYRNAQDFLFCHPAAVPEMRALYPDYKLVKIVREAPLSLEGDSRWIAIEEC